MATLMDFASSMPTRLPTEERDFLLLSAKLTGTPPERLESDTLLLKARFPGHIYHPSFRCDLVDFFADRATYRALGLLVFATLFHRSQCRLRLTTPGDHIRGVTITELVIDGDWGDTDIGPSKELGLFAPPLTFGYLPEPPEARHALYSEGQCDHDMPTITWSNEDGTLVHPEDWETRSTVYGFGSAAASARVAELFLNIGLPSNEQMEFILEGPAGVQSLTPTSAEARFWIGYNYTV